jgi:hypothetical protein
MENEMSTNIADLNSANMQELTSNIQKEIDDGKANDYLSSDRLNNLQEIQMQQLQQLQQMQELQQLQLQQEQLEQNDINDLSDTKETSESFSNNFFELMKDPLMILFLYVLISHPVTQNLLGKWIPNLCSEEIGLTNLIVQGSLLVSLYFLFKLFLK